MRRACYGAVAILVSCATAAAGSGAHAMVGVSSVARSRQLTIEVWLKPDVAGATAFANAVSTPGSPEFHHYLTPRAYTARFGATAAHAATVGAWLTARGLTQVHASPGRDYISATGSVPRIQSASRLPASLAPYVLAVTGLGTTAAPTPVQPQHAVRTPSCSHYWAQYVKAFRPSYRGLAKGSLPVCGYSADQIRAAYGATTSATGQGETVALIEDAPPIAMFRTLTHYARDNHLPAPTSAQFREKKIGASGTCSTSTPGTAQMSYPDEEQMDSEALYAMAPGADQLMVIAEGCNEIQSLLDADMAVLTGTGGQPSASIVSNSWQASLGTISPKPVHAMDLRAAAEGVGMYFSAGDTPGLTVTSSDPYSVAVGGTTLGIGARDNRLFETGWSDDYAFQDGGTWTDGGIALAGDGGTSLIWRQPAYQKGIVPASMAQVRVHGTTVTDRVVPDIAADADFNTGILTGYISSGTASQPGPYQTEVNAGTSLACPLIAGLVADAQQGQSSAFGFIDPLLYRLYGTRALHDILLVTASMPQQDRDAYIPGSGLISTAVQVFDSQEHAYTKQVTAPGYDTMTGIGTPNGAAFIAGLREGAR